MDKNLYNYMAELENVVDGDTIDIKIDLGFDIILTRRLRIYNVDTPELKSSNETEREMAKYVKDVVLRILTGKQLYIKTIKVADKYGRYVADIYIDGVEGSFSDFLIKKGFAKQYDGKGKRESWTNFELMKIFLS